MRGRKYQSVFRENVDGSPRVGPKLFPNQHRDHMKEDVWVLNLKPEEKEKLAKDRDLTERTSALKQAIRDI